MISLEELEVGKCYYTGSCEMGIVIVDFIGSMHVVATDNAGIEVGLSVTEACKEWTLNKEPSHGDEDIAPEFDSEVIHRISHVYTFSLLFITFKSDLDKVYVYNDFPEEMWLLFKSSESKGRFFLNEIKGAYDRVNIFPEIRFDS